MSALIVVAALVGLVFVWRAFGYVEWRKEDSWDILPTATFYFGEVAKAIRERNRKRAQYLREFLTYGYSLEMSEEKASDRMRDEAREAEKVRV